MTKEEIIKELEHLKHEKLYELSQINAELNYVIQKARDDNCRTH